MGTKVKARKPKAKQNPIRVGLCFDHRDAAALATFNAALTGICANPHFRYDTEWAPTIAVAVADEIVAECQRRVALDSKR